MRRTIVPAPSAAARERAAERCHYIGSPEHKSSPSFAGAPKLRHSDATKCDPALKDAQDQITEWLADAIRNETTGDWEGEFPKYAWYRVDGTCYEARLTNAVNGDYKGYALEDHECPAEL